MYTFFMILFTIYDFFYQYCGGFYTISHFKRPPLRVGIFECDLVTVYTFFLIIFLTTFGAVCVATGGAGATGASSSSSLFSTNV